MKAKKNINFTHRALHALPLPPPGKRAVYFDTQVKNLNLIVTDKGNKSFYVRKVIDGVSRRIRLGAFPDLAVEKARDKAMKVKAAIANDENPYEAEQKRKAEPTLAEFFEEYKERHAIPHKKPSSVSGDKHHFTRHIKDRLGNRKLSSISREDIEDLHRDIGKETKYSANRVLALLKTMFSKAIEWGRMKGENPAARVRPFAEKSRDRFLQGDELPRFFAALEREPNRDVRDYVLLSLYTGARKSNLLSMRWDALDFEREVWRIAETKNGHPQNVPLVAPALDVLQRRKKKAAKNAVFVFPSTGKTGHMVEPKSGWKRIDAETGTVLLRSMMGIQSYDNPQFRGSAVNMMENFLYSAEQVLQGARLAKENIDLIHISIPWVFSEIRAKAISGFASIFHQKFGVTPTRYENGKFACCLRPLLAAIKFEHNGEVFAMNLPNRIEDVLCQALSNDKWKTEADFTWGIEEVWELEGHTPYRLPE